MALLGRPSRGWPKQALKSGAFLGMLALGLLLPAVRCAAQQSGEAREYEIKAVFLYNFAEFVEWPPASFADSQSPLVIGILGDDPFGRYLDDAVRGETVNNRPMIIRRYTRIEDVKTCHILFISKSETGRMGKIFAHLKGRNILTVGDMDNFSRIGGMIGFVMEKSKVRLRINLQAAKSTDLRISSKLLRPAEIVSMR